MTDRYWRKIEDVENDIENAMQISSILLKLKEYDDDIEKISNNENNISNNLEKIDNNENNISNNLEKIDNNENNISNNLEKIDNNENNISNNLEKIDNNENNISNNLEKIDNNENNISNNLEKIDNISKFLLKSDKDFEKTYNIESKRFEFNKDNNYFTILEKEIEHDFIKNSLLFVKNNIHYKYDDLSNDYHRCQHEYNIYDEKNNLIHKYLFNKDTYYNENSDILNTNEEFCIFLKQNYNKIKILLELHRHNRHGFGNINLEIDNNNNYVKLDYIEKGFLDNSHLINLNTGSISTNSGKINTNTGSISTNLGKINTNTSSISTNLGKINTNTGSISSNLTKINTNTSSISSNLEKINKLQTSNIKAFYNLDQIFIYDIKNGYQNVDKNNHFHIFEKEITYNFTKNSYLEIALKVLTEVSHYMLIGYFQILCNFYDQDNTLFYTISLSTAMGSINKLSTVKSVFIVPINENMSKIKIDFFIAPKETQENRSARFTILDINSNKIYVKYFQKTDEMSIKDIQDALDSVKNINLEQINTNKTDIASNLNKIGANTTDITNNLSKIESLRKFIYLKNTYFTDFDSTDKTIYKELLRLDGTSKKIVNMFNLDMEYDFKKDDVIEIDCKIILNHNSYDDAKNLALYFELYGGIKALQNKLIFRESRRYNQFPIVLNKDRIIVYTKLCYKVKYDIINIKFRIQLQSLYAKTELILNQEIIPNGSNYIFIKHYGK